MTTPETITGAGTVRYTVDVLSHSAGPRAGNITLRVSAGSTGTTSFAIMQTH